MELAHIAQGWYNFVKGSPETKQMMAERLAICDSCPHKVQISTTGKKIVQAVNKDASLYVCGLCGCPLAALTAAPRKASNSFQDAADTIILVSLSSLLLLYSYFFSLLLTYGYHD